MVEEGKPCVFCQIANHSSSTRTDLLYSDENVIAFRDIKPSAFRHYLVIPVHHIPTTRDLHRGPEDFQLVSHMLNVGQNLLFKDAPASKVKFGFHQPPFNSVNHLHLHCLALPFIPRWKCIKYWALGSHCGFLEAKKLLERINPQPTTNSQ
ncbi:hypothetical protein ZOSMA_31G01250 [Zostera marina]|uniref:HIT domain-containing protein n=1 Tax=Zostera marina TaxID=29655 RepID=A0A0K9PBB1_ZOSMR|nr:hypothetical protein ZOSMA_31G01250 [Zostera marina]